MRRKVFILALALLAAAALVAGCAGTPRSEITSSTQAASGPSTTAGGAGSQPPGTQGGGSEPGATSSTRPDASSASTAPAENATATTNANSNPTGSGLPTVAPLNPAFLDSLLEPITDASVIAAIGRPLGVRPLSQDFLYAQGLNIPSPAELALPGLGGEQGTTSSTTAAPALPRSFDLRTQGRVSAVGDQDPYGTCWSFATLGSMESCLLPGEKWTLSEDNMVLASGFDHGTDAYNWGGNLQMGTAYLVRWSGPVESTADIYGDALTPFGLSPPKHVQEVNWIPARGGPLDNDNVKRAVMQYGGAYVSMSWQDSSSGSLYFNPSTNAYYYFGPMNANHAVLIVGWDDDYPASNFVLNPFGNGAFIVKNSWGTTFGDDGYFYVSYYDSVFGRSDLMGVVNGAEPPGNYSAIYQYDPLGDVNGMGYQSETAWFANVFTANETTTLRAVGFYTLGPGTSYEVYTGPSLAKLQRSTAGTLAYLGYHTVKLPKGVGLSRGTPFVVAVKITSPGTTEPVAIEYPIENFTSKATAKPGQSFVSADGKEWADLTNVYDPNANVCLKAYVRGTPK